MGTERMLRPRLHGRDHRPGGPDPIPAFVHTEIETISAGSAAVNSGAAHVFSLSHFGGATLLDLSSPTDPEILESGIYAIHSTTVEIDAITTVSGTYFVTQIAVTGATLGSTIYHNVNSTAAGQTWENLLIGYMVAGTSFELTVLNEDPSDNLHFSVSARISRIA